MAGTKGWAARDPAEADTKLDTKQKFQKTAINHESSASRCQVKLNAQMWPAAASICMDINESHDFLDVSDSNLENC